ncbi:IclR family transcriptional regulator [Natronococcus wangiae]|uniref:IclR family transcriptional regulator n=1 Tax=Natronococcus wangiae TaxID=3068275 RepID=UPI00273D93C1|nr:IclR family transcriptional regulator [Natronococcus sp. AD5]
MSYKVKTASKLFMIIEAVQKLDEPTHTDLSNHLDLAKSTTHNYVDTLVESGYLVEDDGVYRLSLRFLDHGVHAKRTLPIARISPPILEQLAADTDEAVWLMVEERGYTVGLEKAMGERAVQTAGRIGRHTRFHYHAPGKALLSQMPESRVEELIDQQGLPRKTAHTITDYETLREELEEVRDRGVAFDVGEAIQGIRSVAAPVVSDGSLEGAIAVVGPENRLRDDYFRSELPNLVSGAANELELRLEYGIA